MKIERTGTGRFVQGPSAVQARAEIQGAAAAGSRAVADVTTIMGIPETELTLKVHDAIMALLGEVEQLRRELRESQSRMQHLEKLADEDTLAPIANKRAFLRELNRIMSYSQRYKVPSSLIYFDLNGLKTINDTHGHVAGDAVLLHVANLLIESIRGSDLIGRLGGDEFGVILANADQQLAAEKAQTLARAIETTPFLWEGEHIPLSAAFGAYCFQPGEGTTSALANADRAMYENKRKSRGLQ
ncbi:MAG: GGDEF domain-containing protein [Alphaproteobacteria bacterium]|nr:GGDEF domain-containing protein [Alphaproteobacteria bacterium]